MAAIVEGEGVGRPGKAAVKAFGKYKAGLTDENLKRYAEAYWRSKRREAVQTPDWTHYAVSRSKAYTVQAAVNQMLATHSHR